MSEIVSLKETFSRKSEVFGSALVPMNSHDLEVYGQGTPVTHWFIVGYDLGDRSYIECYAADGNSMGYIDNIDYEVAGIRYSADSEFRRILCQACTDGMDELIRG